MGHLDLKEMCCFVSKHLDARDGEDQHLILSTKLRGKTHEKPERESIRTAWQRLPGHHHKES